MNPLDLYTLDQKSWAFLNLIGQSPPTLPATNITVSGTLGLADGSAASPALYFIAQPTVGIARLISQRLSIIANGIAGFDFSGTQLKANIAKGDPVNPPFTFLEDGGSGTYLANNDVLGIAAGIIKVATFGTQILSDNTASGDLLTLFSGGGSCYTKTKHYTQTGIAAVAKTIHVMDEFACLIFVSGNDGTNFFFEELMGLFGTLPVVKNTVTQGAPAARTYSLSGSSNLQLVMAAGTYATNTMSLQLKNR